MPEVSPSKYLVMAGWDDVPHLGEKTKRELWDSTPEHERKARSQGIPVLGSGQIYPVEEKLIRVNPFPLPDLWPRINGNDFGYDHPAAFAQCAIDRDTDTFYVYGGFKQSKQTPDKLAPRILRGGDWIPNAWPADGLQHEKGTGIQLAQQYRDAGVNMLYEHARFEETGVIDEQKVSRVSVQAGITEILTAMGKGKFKVFSDVADFWFELRLYHRKNGKIVKVLDDFLDAVRYAWMMQRFAVCPPNPTRIVDPRRKSSWRL